MALQQRADTDTHPDDHVRDRPLNALARPGDDQQDAKKGRRTLRVVAMVNNPCVTDARVIRQAEALAQAGHDVLVLAHWSATALEDEVLNGVTYRRFAVRNADKIKRQKAIEAAEQPAVEASPVKGYQAGASGAVALSIDPRASGAAPKRYFEVPMDELAKRVVRRVLNAPARRVVKLLIIAPARLAVRLAFRGLRAGRAGARGVGNLAVRARKSLAVAVVTNGGIEIARHARAFPRPAAEWKPDIVHAHDLYTLLAGYRIARKTGAALVYDSHELEVGRNGTFTKWERFCRATSERLLIKRASAVITVCDSIADFLAERYDIARPVVIHNAPQVGTVDETSDDVRSHIGLALDVPLALYVGSVTTNRGLEQSVRALKHAPEFHLACVGPAADAMKTKLLALADRLEVGDRLHFVPPVTHDQVTSFIRSADLSLILIQDVCLSYRFAFPNKLLESLLAGIPVVAARLPEISRIVEKSGAGVLTDQTDPEAIASSMQDVMRDRDRYVPNEAVREDLKRTYSLEVQNQRLVDLYDRVAAENLQRKTHP